MLSPPRAGGAGGLPVATTITQEDRSRALDDLVALLYAELRRIAHRRLAGGRATLLDTTGLVHECFEKIQQAPHVLATARPQFLAYAAQAMRSIVVDHARRRLSLRRGGGAPHVELDDELVGAAEKDVEVLRVHDALEVLAAHDPRLRQVVELRYFAGLTELEIAELLGVTERTVRRDWHKARVLLHAVLVER